jgi:hypothetical protein
MCLNPHLRGKLISVVADRGETPTTFYDSKHAVSYDTTDTSVVICLSLVLCLLHSRLSICVLLNMLQLLTIAYCSRQAPTRAARSPINGTVTANETRSEDNTKANTSLNPQGDSDRKFKHSSSGRNWVDEFESNSGLPANSITSTHMGQELHQQSDHRELFKRKSHIPLKEAEELTGGNVINCKLHLLADFSFYRDIGHSSSQRAKVIMLRTVRGMDRHFRETRFTENQKADQYGFLVAYVTVLNNEDTFKPQAQQGSFYVDPSSYVRVLSDIFKSANVCMLVGFTALPFPYGMQHSEVTAALHERSSKEFSFGSWLPDFLSKGNEEAAGVVTSIALSFKYTSQPGLHIGHTIAETGSCRPTDHVDGYLTVDQAAVCLTLALASSLAGTPFFELW